MPDDTEREPLVPARMLNEFVYCPRLAILEWVDGEFAHSGDTMEGAVRHAAVDRPGFRTRPRREESADGAGAEAPAPGAVQQIRSVELSDPGLGLVAKIDLVEVQGNRVQPVDVKKGKRPHVEKGAYEPERVQVCAQGLLLRAHGYQCDSGFLYFAGSNERVEVAFDEELVATTLGRLRERREAARASALPPPLENSPKCVRCSLAPICLPDETRFLRDAATPPRRLVPAGDHLFPLYVQQPGAVVRKKDDALQVFDGEEKLGEVRTREVSQLVLMGRVTATEAVYQELLGRGTPIVHLSSGGWLYGVTQGLPHANVRLRCEQVRAADDPQRSLRIARELVVAKIQNQRTFLRRNAPEGSCDEAVNDLRNAANAAARSSRIDELRGHEGYGGRVYFSCFARMLRAASPLAERFDVEGRNRRPPRDPVNAMLSFAYSMLSREWVTVCLAVGFDPFLGFYHALRYARPSLALDLMEAFRPLCADSVVVRAINNGEIGPDDFVERMGAVNLSPAGRRKLLRSFELRLGQEITHPVFGYRISYRRVFEVECRLLARHVLGEIPAYQPLTTR
jgi:CRISPR-associated protein Cas1